MHLVPRVKYWSDTCGYKLAVIAVAHQEFTLFRQHSIPPPSPSTVPFHSVIVGKAKSALSMYIRFNSRTRSICTARRASAAFEWQTVYQECNSLYFAAHAHCDHMAVAWRGQLSRVPPARLVILWPFFLRHADAVHALQLRTTGCSAQRIAELSWPPSLVKWWY